jgi:hypothetical protein
MHLEKVYNALKERSRFLIEILTSRTNFTIKRYKKEGIVIKKGSWRFYSAHEIKNILEGISFKFIAGYDNLNKELLTKDTRLMRLVFEK